MSAITERLYRTSTLGHVRMMGRVLNGLEMRCGGKIALLCARQSDFAELNATREDAEGIVNLGLEIEGVQAAALLTEREGLIKCSLRAKEPLDVSAVASRFGGGGHIRAAGCSFEGATLEEARERIAKALEEIVS